MNIAIIPARGGSRRIPRKNIKIFHGKPIIAYSIEAARKSNKFECVVVTTDDSEIASVAFEYGATVYRRPSSLGKDEIGTQQVVRECLMGMGYFEGDACCIYATAPLISHIDLQNAHARMDRDESLQYVFSVTTDGVCIADTGQWYWGRIKAFINKAPLVGHSTSIWPLPDSMCCDINTPEDWIRAEQMYAALKGKEAA